MEPLVYGQRTDVGRVRKANQDSLAVLSKEQLNGLADALFVVADGMGGRAGGEIASRVTVETVPKVVKEVLAEEKHLELPERMREAVHEALLAANDAVYGQAKANPELRGMGTTCVAVLVAGGLAVVGNIGDSRVYLLRAGGFRALTHDHSLVAQHLLAGELTEDEARASRYRNIITRAIGIAEAVEPDTELILLQPGDTILLCSDGLTNMLTDPEIARILARGDDPDTTCMHLVTSANAAGGADNITAVLARYGRFTPVEIPDPLEDDADAYPLPPNRNPVPRRSFLRFLQIPALLVLVVAAWFILSRYELDTRPPYLTPRKPDMPFVPAPVPPAKDLSRVDYGPAPRLLAPGSFRPSILEVTPGGTPVVSDAESGRIQRIAGRPEEYPRRVLERGVEHLAVDKDRNVYYYSPLEKAIVKINVTGAQIKTIGKGTLTKPAAIAVDANGNVYVIDDGQLKMFRAIPPPPAGGTGNAPR